MPGASVLKNWRLERLSMREIRWWWWNAEQTGLRRAKANQMASELGNGPGRDASVTLRRRVRVDEVVVEVRLTAMEPCAPHELG